MEMRKLLVVTMTNCHQLCQISLLSPNTDQGNITQRNLVYPVGGISTVEGSGSPPIFVAEHFLKNTWTYVRLWWGAENKRGRNVVKVIFLRV